MNVTSHSQDLVAVEPSAAAIGRVAEVHGPVVDIACETLPPLHRALRVTTGDESAVLEVLHHLDSHHVRAIALHRTAGLQRGTRVFDSGGPLRVPVSRSVHQLPYLRN
jgi:F-type H+/Na+-transporting ATPase subunit beta